VIACRRSGYPAGAFNILTGAGQDNHQFGDGSGGHKAMADSTPPPGGSQTPASPPKKGSGSLVWWAYLGNYVLLGLGALTIAVLVWEGIDSGKWDWKGFVFPLLFIVMAISNLAAMHAQERKRAELGAAPDPARDSSSGHS
jgi:hypothetical protein